MLYWCVWQRLQPTRCWCCTGVFDNAYNPPHADVVLVCLTTPTTNQVLMLYWCVWQQQQPIRCWCCTGVFDNSYNQSGADVVLVFDNSYNQSGANVVLVCLTTGTTMMLYWCVWLQVQPIRCWCCADVFDNVQPIRCWCCTDVFDKRYNQSGADVVLVCLTMPTTNQVLMLYWCV